MTEGGRSPRRIAVTGANGYIGRRLVAALIEARYDVVALVRDVSATRSFPKSVEVRDWSLADVRADDVRGVDVVCHLAAFIPPRMDDPAFAERCILDNGVGTLRLISAMQAAGIPRLIYFSTGQLYRPGAVPAREDAPLDPVTRAPYYLGSKLLGEIYGRHAAARQTLDVVTVRPGSVYGPEMSSGATVSRMIADAQSGRGIRLEDGGRYGVDMVLVDDVIAATLAVIERRVSGVFNVGSGVRTTMADLAASIVARWGGRINGLESEANPGGAAPGFAPLDISRARHELDYIPTTLEAGLDRIRASSAPSSDTRLRT